MRTPKLMPDGQASVCRQKQNGNSLLGEALPVRYTHGATNCVRTGNLQPTSIRENSRSKAATQLKTDSGASLRSLNIHRMLMDCLMSAETFGNGPATGTEQITIRHCRWKASLAIREGPILHWIQRNRPKENVSIGEDHSYAPMHTALVTWSELGAKAKFAPPAIMSGFVA